MTPEQKIAAAMATLENWQSRAEAAETKLRAKIIESQQRHERIEELIEQLADMRALAVELATILKQFNQMLSPRSQKLLVRAAGLLEG